MSNRERKRKARHKRKQRSSAAESAGQEESNDFGEFIASPDAERVAETKAGGNGSPAAAGARVGESASERKDREAREALVPLAEGERPTVITVAAVITGILFVLSVAGWVLWDVFRDEERPPLAGVIVFSAIFGAMAWGLWRAKYWAALGFQTLLLFAILSSTAGLLQATTVLQAIGNTVFLGGSGLLFFRGIKAMARIQMPSALPPDRR